MTHFLSYCDNNGIEHDSYEDACRYYGADTPDMLVAEAKADQEDWLISVQDRIEAGGPRYGSFMMTDMEIPF